MNCRRPDSSPSVPRPVQRRLRSASLLPLLIAAAPLWLACTSEHSAEPKVKQVKAPTSASSLKSAVPKATASAKPPPPPAGPPEKLSVLLLTIDSLRADMPWTGYPRKIAPNLSKLAARGTTYLNAYSPSSYTAKSVSGMLTGRYPSTIYRSGWFFAGFPDSNLFFTEVLQQRGVRTLGGHAHMYFDKGKNLDQGFDEWRITKGISFNSQTDEHVTSDKMTDMAIEMLSDEKNSAGQFFMWLHYMDPHDKYVVHKESPDFGKKNRDRYDSEVFFTDLHIGRLLKYIEAQPWGANTAVIVSADHGEAFGEHGMYKHAFELWEVLTHVPLLVVTPGGKAQRVEERRSQIDLAPTILELMGVKEQPKSFSGKSLVPELYGLQKPGNREPIILDLPEDKNNPERHAIISGDYKLLAYGPGVSFKLFNLKTDPGEEKDLSKKEPAEFKRMKTLYKQTFDKLETVEPYGGMKMRSGKTARGSKGPSPASSGSK